MPRLDDIADIVGGYAFKSDDLGDVGIPVIKIADIEPPVVSLASCQRVPSFKTHGLQKFLLQPRDIVMAMTGATTGKVGRYRAAEPVYLNQRVAKISAKHGREYDDYVYALVTEPGFANRVLNNASGSAQPNVSAEGIGRVEVPFLAPKEQLAVGRIVAILDEKIELNRKMSETLEAISGTLFKSWFIDFDPVHWNAQRLRTALAGEIAARFPSSFTSSSLGAIPRGWTVSKIGKDLQTVLGGTPSRDNPAFWNGGNVPWINSGKVNEFRIVKPATYITEDALKRSAAKLLPERTTVLAITGATLGQVSLLEIAAAANQSVVGILGTDQVPSEYIYNWIRSRIGDLINRQTGGAQQHVNKTDINDVALLIPCPEVMAAYITLVRPIFDRIKVAYNESAVLQALRKLVLPKLISGELRIRDAERTLKKSDGSA